MKKILNVLPLFLLCGCLSPVTVPSVSYWLMEFRDSPAVVKTPKYSVARLSQVIVNLPYAGDRFVILKGDGSVALDPLNVFAAPPSALAKSVGLSALTASGLFADVVGASSMASASVSVEIVVSRLAIDCRQEGSRRAVAAVLVRILNGKTTAALASGEGDVDASDGDYGVAFSKALSSALASALSKVR